MESLAAAQEAAAGANESAVEAARQTRDAAWQRHRVALDAVTADAFAAEMATHDRLVAGLARAAAREEAVRRAAEAAAEAEATYCARDLKRVAAARAVDQRSLSDLAEALGLPANTPPEALAPRLDRLREIGRAAPAARRADEALAAAETERDRQIARLRSLLPEPDAKAEDVEDAARRLLRGVEAAAEDRGRHAAAKAALEKARTAQVEATGALRAAEDHLAAARVAVGVGELALEDLPELHALETEEHADAGDAAREAALLHARELAAPELGRLAALGDGGNDPVAFARARAAEDAKADLSRKAAAETLRVASVALEKAVRRDEAGAADLTAALTGQGGMEEADGQIARLSEAARLNEERSGKLREAASSIFETVLRADRASVFDDSARNAPPRQMLVFADGCVTRAEPVLPGEFWKTMRKV